MATTGRKQNETESPKSNDIIDTSRESNVVEEHPEKETLTKETNEQPKEMGKLWVDVVSDNTNLANGMVIKYLRGTTSVRLYFGGDKPTLLGYSDFDMDGDIDSIKNTSGYMIKFAGGDVAWNSTTEVEFIEIIEACKELL
ncbi:hypothetical protein KIW84_054978 [Lathyrus oleraceus]|uniref:Uncharacterized protein n=1 Tax=Pisum sativum TaxID=3888 RepID=A0A9D4WVQ2_PEA|nr:hypothetical protein KIW84_054978 [Pisum sativum]